MLRNHTSGVSIKSTEFDFSDLKRVLKSAIKEVSKFEEKLITQAKVLKELTDLEKRL